MTREEAIEVLNGIEEVHGALPEDGNKIEEALSMAIKALEQEPREVLYSGDGYAEGEMVYDMAECPNCGRKFEDGDETWNCNFCPECGQALDWGLDNAEED